jgi:hypothetical protein
MFTVAGPSRLMFAFAVVNANVAVRSVAGVGDPHADREHVGPDRDVITVEADRPERDVGDRDLRDSLRNLTELRLVFVITQTRGNRQDYESYTKNTGESTRHAPPTPGPSDPVLSARVIGIPDQRKRSR